MLRRVIICLAAFFLFINAAQTTFAQIAPAEKNRLDLDELVIGDWYEVATKWQGTEMPLAGTLVKLTDEWMVLGVVHCQSSDVATFPVLQEVLDACGGMRLADIPYVGSMLSKREGYYSKSYYWIPRHLAKITSREVITNADVKLDFQNDSPMLSKPQGVVRDNSRFRANNSIVWTEDGKASQIDFDAITESGDNVSVIVDKEGERKVERVIRFDTVSYIWQQVHYDYWEAQRARQEHVSN